MRSIMGVSSTRCLRGKMLSLRSGCTSTPGWAVAKSSRSSQCTVARYPSNSPARAITQAPASTPATSRNRPAIRLSSRSKGPPATSSCRYPTITINTSAPSAARSGPDDGNSIPQVSGTGRPSGETTRQR